MDTFIEDQLRPTETCSICCTSFSSEHQPAGLPCQHVFGYECIKKWFTEGQGNSNACPYCRLTVIPSLPTTRFDAVSIWKAICAQRSDMRQSFMSKMWTYLKPLWKLQPRGQFSTSSLLHHAILPALLRSGDASRDENPFSDAFTLIYSSCPSLAIPYTATGIAIPLVRLVRLMVNASQTLPAWLTDNPRTNALLWLANACVDWDQRNISWDHIMKAALPDAANDERFFPLLSLYTVLMSQSVAHDTWSLHDNLRRHELMNRVVEQCCKKIGGDTFTGKPSNEFKDVLVEVYQELRRYQIGKSKQSLRGNIEESTVIKGMWAVARWSVVKS